MQNYLEKILACPRCKEKLTVKNHNGHCFNCKFSYTKQGGIWRLLYTRNRLNQKSLAEYDQMHQDYFGGPTDGSYEILSAIARGNKTVDIACGEGLIEKMAPETVGVEFSENALQKAKKNGAKYLILADAHALPFQNNAFDIAISAGSLEHMANPQKAVSEMARVSKIQVLTVHREFDFLGARLARIALTKLLNIKHQPIEIPLKWHEIEKMLIYAGLKIVFKGFWTLPVNYGRVLSPLPEFKRIPSCYFVISQKINATK